MLISRYLSIIMVKGGRNWCGYQKYATIVWGGKKFLSSLSLLIFQNELLGTDVNVQAIL